MTMKKEEKKTYSPPAITEVKFEDKNLVAFNVCSKQTRIEGDSASCCLVQPENIPNKDTFDPS